MPRDSSERLDSCSRARFAETALLLKQLTFSSNNASLTSHSALSVPDPPAEGCGDNSFQNHSPAMGSTVLNFPEPIDVDE